MTWPHGGGKPAEPPAHYELRVQGGLDSRWSAWFEGLQVSSDDHGVTTIAGPVTDQAALHGLLAKVRDLGLPLVSVHQIDSHCPPIWRPPCRSPSGRLLPY